MGIGLSNRDYLRFLKIYFQKPLKSIFKEEVDLISQAQKRAEKIKERSVRKGL